MPSARIHESQYSPPPVFRRGCDGLTPQSFTDVIGNLGTLVTDNMSRNARSTHDSKQRMMSDHKFDTSKILPYTGDCILGTPDEYWLCPGSWTREHY